MVPGLAFIHFHEKCGIECKQSSSTSVRSESTVIFSIYDDMVDCTVYATSIKQLIHESDYFSC